MIISTIKEEDIIDIQVNGSFYARIQALMFYLLEGKEPQFITEVFDKIKDNQIDDAYVAHLQTVVVLMREIEEQAKQQDKITEKDVEESTED
jgi:hypothetical protein